MADLLPGIFILFGVYVVARMLNHRDYVRRVRAYEEQERQRRNRIDALYGRKK